MKKLTNTDERLSSKKQVIIGFYLFIIVLWQGLTVWLEIPAYILPSPLLILTELYQSFPLLMMHTRVTLTEVLLGFSISIMLSVILSVLMDRHQTLKDLIYPLIVVSQTIPIIAIAPLLMVWFGVGLLRKVIVVVLVCFFPIAVSLTEGLNAADPELVDLMRTMKASERQIFLKCKLPAALPSFFSGLRIAATYSVLGAVVAEWVGAQEGLGIFMTRVMKSYRIPALFASIIIIVVMTLVLVACVDWIGRKAMPWKNEKRSR
jgi:ABC-type nitrate/sulfonate/bicarbonate transport system permease component